MRCDENQGALGAGNVEVTSLASGRNTDVSEAMYFFADEPWEVHLELRTEERDEDRAGLPT